MNGAAMASFLSAAETPDRDDDYDERPVVTCADCGSLLGSYPAGVYADCEECGGFTLSQWVPESEGPSDEDIAAREAAWAEASLREHLSEERARAEAAEAEVARLTTERDAARRAATLAEAERDTLRGLTDALRESDVRLRAEAAGLRAALDGATERLEAFGAIAHVVVGYDDGPVDTVIAACAELPFVRIENKRLRAIVEAVRHERAVRAAWLATLPACASAPADVVAAEAATGAALAEEGR